MFVHFLPLPDDCNCIRRVPWDRELPRAYIEASWEPGMEDKVVKVWASSETDAQLDLISRLQSSFLTITCLNLIVLIFRSEKHPKTFSLESQKFFSITLTIFSHSRSERIWKQNTISFSVQLLAASHTSNFVDGKDEREKNL